MAGYVPTVSCEAMSAAVYHLRENWGDYGYSIGVRTGIGGSGVFLVRHTDGSEFTFQVDLYGNVRDDIFHDPEGDAHLPTQG